MTTARQSKSKKAEIISIDDSEASSDDSDGIEKESGSGYSYDQSLTSYSDSDDEELRVQCIIGIRTDPKKYQIGESVDITDIPKNTIEYMVKWTNRSHIHNKWLKESDLLHYQGGEIALKKFRKQSQDGLVKSRENPEILMTSQDDISSNWIQVDRIIGNREPDQFLVKWKGLSYDSATWENKADIPKADQAILEFKKRKKHRNPIKIPPKSDSKRQKVFSPLVESPVASDGSVLRDYQLSGVNWLRFCYHEQRNSILADEMGLGKTVQVVSVLKDISNMNGVSGPFLVISPLSTLSHWKYEFHRWTSFNTVVFHGNPQTRNVIQQYEFYRKNDKTNVMFDVLITNYETFTTEYNTFKGIEWRYLVLDEAHRLKNHTGKCYQLISQLSFEHCTLLTGTPIQNNVEELWSLLHLIHPSLFYDLADFLEKFGEIEDIDTLQALQKIINPFLLRRKKSDVDTSIAEKEETIIEVELTRVQKTYYRAFLHENASTLLQQITASSLPSLQNLMMQLRKVCNHPFLIKGATEHIESQMSAKLGKDSSKDEIELRSLVDSSGKMILVDKLLPKLKKDGHKVLIFSQMIRVLDIIEDYLIKKDIEFERIDGNVSEIDRQAAIERFAIEKDVFVFLLCTRAGGVGINLTAADTVIIYDSDWNPQNDIQAQSRCHRIGQKAKVKVYRLVTRGTYELEMLDRASKKLGLDHALLDGGQMNRMEPAHASEIERLLRRGAYDITRDDDTEIDNFCTADIDQILDTRSKEFTRDPVSGSSMFSKAKFDSEKDTLDLNATDFWNQVFPGASFDINEPLSMRRCRRMSNTQLIDVSSDSSSDEGQTDKQKKKNSPVSIRGTIKSLIHYGIGDSPYQKSILYHATQVVDSISDSDMKIICQILGFDDMKSPPSSIIDTLNEFSSNLNDVKERSNTIIRRCVLFYRLDSLILKLQLPIMWWPVMEGSDPMEDYANLLGVYRNGFSDIENLANGLDCEPIKVMSIKTLEKKLITLVSSLEDILKQVEAPDLERKEAHEEIPPRKSWRGSELLPQKWKEMNPSLYNRGELTSNEMASLFQTIHLFGTPRNEKGETDYSLLQKNSLLTSISLDAIQEATNIILDLSTRLESDFEEHILPLKNKLGQYASKLWFKKLKSNLHDLDKVREFVRTMGNPEIAAMSRLKPFSYAEWWEAPHDIAMLQSMSKYGQLLVSTWVVDPSLPFREHIPENLVEEFEKCASQELEKNRPSKPHDGGSIGFIFRDKVRVTRALSAIKQIETLRDKPYTQDNQFQIDTVYIKSLPVNINQQLTVFSFGQFPTYESQYPVGYVAHRLYHSIKNPMESDWYEASTSLDNHGCIVFIVKLLSDPYHTYYGNNPGNAWEQIIVSAQHTRGTVYIQRGEVHSGVELFGFTNHHVQEQFYRMKQSIRPVRPSIPMLSPKAIIQIRPLPIPCILPKEEPINMSYIHQDSNPVYSVEIVTKDEPHEKEEKKTKQPTHRRIVITK